MFMGSSQPLSFPHPSWPSAVVVVEQVQGAAAIPYPHPCVCHGKEFGRRCCCCDFPPPHVHLYTLTQTLSPSVCLRYTSTL